MAPRGFAKVKETPFLWPLKFPSLRELHRQAEARAGDTEEWHVEVLFHQRGWRTLTEKVARGTLSLRHGERNIQDTEAGQRD